MDKKTSAHYQREFRRRLREQGLVKKEVWIRPENARLLSRAEKQLRLPGGGSKEVMGGVMVSEASAKNVSGNASEWTTRTLYKALKAESYFINGTAAIELIEGAEPSLHIVMREFGDLPVFATVAGEQIIVESVLWPQAEVNDVAGFNEAVLRTHKYFPLSTISLDRMEDGSDYYHMFGALSAASSIADVVLEVEVLATNVIQATEAYGEFLKS
ncbi:MAG: YjfI family protein [Hahellaceae bacterium]|jgi:hypothetical protein|nr:YjfI family protein [Hahellaceae bacterium]MCP5213163.1 YjfI family protein [Hahellaceae bacterium]